MGRIVFLWIFLMTFILSGCGSNLIIIKHRGQLVNHLVFTHEMFKVYQSNTWYYKINMDSIHLDSLQLPPILKKYLLSNHQNKSEVIYQAGYKSITIGNAFVCYQQTHDDIDNYTKKCANALNKNLKIEHLNINKFANLTNKEDTSDAIPFFVYPSKFMQNAKFNTITFDINHKGDSFAVTECHIPIEKQKSILKVIHIIDIKKSKKNLDNPFLWRSTFKDQTLGWVATLDTNPIKVVTHRNINNLFSYADSLLLKYGHQATLDSLLYIDNVYTQSNDFQLKSYYYQVLMTYYSFMGKNDSSLKYQDISLNKKPVNDPVSFDSNTRKIEAVDFIAQKYGKQSVIMINEAHNRGQNRHFTKQLLPALYKQGFRYLAVEALSYDDSLLQQRGYPIAKTGIYIKEPAFGQLIREAISLGFKLVTYESRLPYNPKLSMMEGQNAREMEQANHIAAILQKDPTAKVLIHAGHGHIYKKTEGNWVRMGALLSQLLQWDIPSIECTGMMEAFEPEKENPFYKKAMTVYPSTEPFVLIQNDTPFVKPSLKGYVNVQVFFPRTNYSDGYPHWLKETTRATHTILVNNSLRNKHLLIYREQEWLKFKNEAIPIFQTTVNSNEIKLFLKKGKYRAYIFKNSYDDFLFEKEFNIFN